MTLYLYRYNPKGQCKEVKRINLDAEPCPTIMAGGVWGDNRSHYWLQDDGREMKQVIIDKPKYQVPSMQEIEAIPWNGFNAISTFSGAGGSCLGYKMAGFRVLWASEFIPAATQVYRLNHPNSILDTRDIRKVQPQDILDAIGLQQGEVDLLDGSPPCASFSTASKREKGWGQVKKYSDTKQRVDDLFFEYARIVRGIQPKVFVAENVSGLVKGKAKGYFKLILKELKSCGYIVKAKLLDAQWLGVPQARQRVIFVGVRKDLGLQPAYPKPLGYRYSVREAILWIDALNSRHYQVHYPVEAATDISRFAIGDEWDNVPVGGKSNKYLSLCKPHLDKPCNTVTQTLGLGTGPNGEKSGATVMHPTEKRRFSIAELKRICAFPDDFQLTGTYAQQWERLGRAVPPVMMKYIAQAIRDQVLNKL